MKNLIIITVLVLAVSGISYAGPVSVGDTVEGNSWSQGWRESGVGNFDTIASKMISAGDTFESTVFFNFSNGGWASIFETEPVWPTIAVSSGPAVTSLNFSMRYPDPKTTNPFAFSFVAFNGNTLVDGVDINWTGSNWTFGVAGAATWQPDRFDLPFFSAGTLTGTTTSIQGDFIYNTAVVFDQSFDGTYADIMSGTGTLTKSGAGSLTLSGNNTYTGTTTLSAGTLNLSGQLFGNVVVNGGMFMGTGTIANSGSLTLNSGGTFSPGAIIGTTTISGDYTQNSNSILNVEVSKAANGKLSSDLVDVTGTATLESGSTVNVIDLTPTTHLIGTGETFTVISAAGGITDNGATVTDTSAVLSFAGLIVGNDYVLEATRNTFASVASNSNNASILGALDSDAGAASGDYVTLLNALTALGASDMNAAAERLNLFVHGSSSAVTASVTRGLISDMTRYLHSRRQNSALLTRFDIQQSDLLLADASDDPETLRWVINESERFRSNHQKSRSESNYFIKPFGQFQSQDSTDKFVGFNSKSAGAHFGYDKLVNEEWIVGLGAAYSHSRLDFDENMGDSDIGSFRVGPYATFFRDSFFVDTSVTASYHMIDTERDVRFPGINRTAKADYDAYDINAYVGSGYDIYWDGWTVTPSASLQYTSYRSEGFTESEAGAANLVVNADTQESLLTRIGVRMFSVTNILGCKTVPEVFAGYAHEFMVEESMTSRFVQGTNRFSTGIDSERDDSLFYGVGLSSMLSKSVSAFIRYEGEIYSGNRSEIIDFGLSVRF